MLEHLILGGNRVANHDVWFEAISELEAARPALRVAWQLNTQAQDLLNGFLLRGAETAQGA